MTKHVIAILGVLFGLQSLCAAQGRIDFGPPEPDTSPMVMTWPQAQATAKAIINWATQMRTEWPVYVDRRRRELRKEMNTKGQAARDSSRAIANTVDRSRFVDSALTSQLDEATSQLARVRQLDHEIDSKERELLRETIMAGFLGTLRETLMKAHQEKRIVLEIDLFADEWVLTPNSSDSFFDGREYCGQLLRSCVDHPLPETLRHSLHWWNPNQWALSGDFDLIMEDTYEVWTSRQALVRFQDLKTDEDRSVVWLVGIDRQNSLEELRELAQGPGELSDLLDTSSEADLKLLNGDEFNVDVDTPSVRRSCRWPRLHFEGPHVGIIRLQDYRIPIDPFATFE